MPEIYQPPPLTHMGVIFFYVEFVKMLSHILSLYSFLYKKILLFSAFILYGVCVSRRCMIPHAVMSAKELNTSSSEYPTVVLCIPFVSHGVCSSTLRCQLKTSRHYHLIIRRISFCLFCIPTIWFRSYDLWLYTSLCYRVS